MINFLHRSRNTCRLLLSEGLYFQESIPERWSYDRIPERWSYDRSKQRRTKSIKTELLDWGTRVERVRNLSLSTHQIQMPAHFVIWLHSLIMSSFKYCANNKLFNFSKFIQSKWIFDEFSSSQHNTHKLKEY